MERLPYIDERSRSIGAPRERTWAALIATGAELGVVAPAQVARLARLEPGGATGDWSGEPAAGATRPGFAVEEVHAPSRLALAGSHRFSRYSLIFELDESGSGGTLLRARTRAAFPGALGRAYRALVIASGAHRIVVGRLLRKVEMRACSV
jgi:hypothetical protein